MTGDALPALVGDLVTPSGGAAVSTRGLEARAVASYESQRRTALLRFLGPSLICWVIWLASGVEAQHGQWPWPLIVTAILSLRLLRTLTGRREIVAAEVRRLQAEETQPSERTEQGGQAGRYTPPPLSSRPDPEA